MLTVDPQRKEGANGLNPLLTLSTRRGEVVWVRVPGDFADFRLVFDIRTGDVLTGEVVEDQGDDRDWFEQLQREEGS